jgi:hypothetical protein
MRKIVLENVRSFAGLHEIPVAPLTILTGENSSGKSTFLACNAIVDDPDGFPLFAGFNLPPYNLGGYETIATFKGGKSGRAKFFKLGAAQESETPGQAFRVLATYKNLDGRPWLCHFAIHRAQASVIIKLEQGGDGQVQCTLELSEEGRMTERKFNLLTGVTETRRARFSDILLNSLFRSVRAQPKASRKASDVVDRVWHVFRGLESISSISLAPVRTKPERIYGQISEEYDPAGNHIPLILENLFSKSASPKDRKEVTSALERFGKESGMFTKVSVRKIGKKPTDPFQILVTVAGRPANLMDVGYGVSQALPVIVQSALSNAPRVILMQQPEVHLHPKAQAALGTFFADLVQTRKKQLVIETHSDFIIDRLRQEVATGKLDADKVLILFFQKDRIDSVVHPITLDALGNLHGAPPSYRQFFLEEEMRMFRRAD